MEPSIPMFTHVEIETASMCNRKCPTCMRQTVPDKERSRSWHERNLMPFENITRAFAELGAMQFTGEICLNHYNEPLMDDRLPGIAAAARKLVPGAVISMHTNGDLMTAELAGRLDGVFHRIVYAAYSSQNRDEREQWMLRQFTATYIVLTRGEHMMTHFYPGAEERAAEFIEHACFEPTRRLILNHKGEMLLCCSDVFGYFDLGRFPKRTLTQLWNDPKHIDMVLALMQPGGRKGYEHCRICPRMGWLP